MQTAISSDIAPEYHQLEMKGGLILSSDNGTTLMGLIPPIVEETAEEGAYILDGAHRASIGRWSGRTGFMAVHITDIRKDCPAYAYPNNWEEIKIVEETPENLNEKKHYRGDNFRSLYRDFSELNGGKLREK